MSNLLKFRQEVMDPISPTFCASKWYDAVIFLNEGRTKSCHHTPAHPISEVEVKFEPRTLHNTEEKKEQRSQMLAGERPKACRYCWNIEDAVGDNGYSDRVPYTKRYSEDDIANAATMGLDANAPLRTLEVSFDRTCNFACSYCGPRFSTTWAKDIRNNGRYVLKDAFEYYGHDGSELAEPYGKHNEGNPYLEAFWKWWPELSQTLDQFRITGGEPLMSASFWKLVEKIREDGVRDDMVLSVNTNLGAKKELIDDLIAFTHDVPRFSLFTSCEAHGKAAEYLRDGLDYDYWLDNLRRVAAEGRVQYITIMTTITAASLFSFPEFLDDILSFRKETGAPIMISFNILKSPNFMSCLVLPEELRHERARAIMDWVHANRGRLLDWEDNGARRLCRYLWAGEDPLWTDDLRARLACELDFYLFYKQYDERRGKSFRDTFHPLLVEWYDELSKQYAADITTAEQHIAAERSKGYKDGS